MSDENDHSQIIDNIQNEEEISTDEIFVETDKVLEAETIIKEINVVPHEEVGAETIVDEINVVLHEVVEAAMSTDEIPAVPDKVVLNCCDIITARYNEKLNELEDKIKEVEEKKSVKELMLTRAENTIKKLKSQNKVQLFQPVTGSY